MSDIDQQRGQGTKKDEGQKGGVVFMGNYDQGILCPKVFGGNIDGVFGADVEVTGALAQKARDVAPRAIWYLSDNDAALLYQRPERSFLDYAEDLYGHRIRVIAPRDIIPEPLNLFSDTMRDPSALAELSRGVQQEGWRLSPFIQSPDSARLAKHIGAQLDGGACRDAIERGLALDLNDKASFTEICQSLGIPVPETVCVRGWNHVARGEANLVDTTKRLHHAWGGLMLRQARAAGGLGNLVIRPTDSVDERLALVHNQPGWQTETVVVTPFLEIECSPATLAFIHLDGSVDVLSDSVQLLKGGAAYIGSIMPSGLRPEIVAQMIEWTKLYATRVAQMGGRGYVNVDWILVHGKLYACESNCRYTAVVHPRAIRQRLCNGSRRIARSHDALHVEDSLTFTDALGRLGSEGLLFDSQTRKGAVISIPPARGSMGYVVMAESVAEASDMTEAIHRVLEHDPY